jgi:hypothetical protein
MPTYVTEWYLLPQSAAHPLRAIERPAPLYLSFCVFILFYFLLAYLLTYSMQQKLTVSQLVKKFPAFYGTWRFITKLTSARHLPLSGALLYFLKLEK